MQTSARTTDYACETYIDRAAAVQQGTPYRKSGIGHRFLWPVGMWPVGMGLRPAKFHEKPAYRERSRDRQERKSPAFFRYVLQRGGCPGRALL